jgi:hypothetical protein
MPRLAFSVLLLVTPATASANHLKDGLLAVNKALGQVRAAGGVCQEKALSKLKDARDTLNMARGRASVDLFTKARRSVEDAMDDAGGACTGGAAAAIQSTLESLQAGIDALANAVETPSPADKRLREKRACWNYVNDGSRTDPGCHVTRDGNYAIGKPQLHAILAKVRKVGDRFGKTQVVEEELGYAKKPYVTCLQLGTVAQHLLHDNDRLELVKATAERIVDPGNSNSIVRQIRDARIRKEAQRVITEAAE